MLIITHQTFNVLNYFTGVTILLGTSNRPGQEGGVLLQSVPQFVFPIAIALVFFHLAVWVLLTVIDLLQKKGEYLYTRV